MPNWLLNLIEGGILRDAPQEGAAGGGAEKTTTPPTQQSQQSGLDDDEDEDADDIVSERRDGKDGWRTPTRYEKRLRTENAQKRQTIRELQGKMASEKKAYDDAIKAANAAADQRVNDAIAATKKDTLGLLSRVRLEAEAEAQGILDLDTLRLLDIDGAGIKVDDKGVVTGVAEAIAEFKKSKPGLFKPVDDKKTTTSTQRAPEPKSGEGKSAKDMTDDEWKAAKAKLGLR
jgi:hypothetical protein